MRGLSGSNSIRGSSGYDSMFSRRTPPRSSNGLGRFRLVTILLFFSSNIISQIAIHSLSIDNLKKTDLKMFRIFFHAVIMKTSVVIHLMIVGRHEILLIWIVVLECADSHQPIDMPHIKVSRSKSWIIIIIPIQANKRATTTILRRKNENIYL